MSEANSPVRYPNAVAVGLVCMLTAASAAMHQFKMPMIMGQVIESTGMSETAATWTMSIFLLTAVIFALPAGTVAARFGAKNVMLCFAVIASAGSVLGALTTSTAIILISRAIEGIGFIFVGIAGVTCVVSYVEPNKIGRAIGIWATWVPIGQIAAFNLTTLLIQFMSWQVIWYIFAAFTLVMAVILKFVLQAPQGLPEAASQEKVKFSIPIKELFGNKQLVLVSISFLMFAYLLFIILNFFPVYAGETAIMSMGEVAIVASLPMVGSIIGSPLLGLLSEKLGRKKLYLLSLIATGIGAVLYFVNISDPRALIYIGGALVGLIGLAAPPMVLGSMGTIVGKPELIGPGSGLVTLAQNLGMFFTTVSFMAIVTGFGGFFAASLIAIPIAAVGVILAIKVKLD